jgi:hypothetical protein
MPYNAIKGIWEPDIKPINAYGQTPERAAQYAEEADNYKFARDLFAAPAAPQEDPNDPTTEAGWRQYMLGKKAAAEKLKAPTMESESKITKVGLPLMALAIAALSKAPNNAAVETMQMNDAQQTRKLDQYNKDMERYTAAKTEADKALEGAYQTALGNKLKRTQLAGEELGQRKTEQDINFSDKYNPLRLKDAQAQLDNQELSQKKTQAEMDFDALYNPLRLSGAQTTIDKAKQDMALETAKQARLKAYQQRVKNLSGFTEESLPMEEAIQAIGAEATAYEDPTKLYKAPASDDWMQKLLLQQNFKKEQEKTAPIAPTAAKVLGDAYQSITATQQLKNFLQNSKFPVSSQIPIIGGIMNPEVQTSIIRAKDLLARMRTGAAMTKNEETFYQKYFADPMLMLTPRGRAALIDQLDKTETATRYGADAVAGQAHSGWFEEQAALEAQMNPDIAEANAVLADPTSDEADKAAARKVIGGQ